MLRSGNAEMLLADLNTIGEGLRKTDVCVIDSDPDNMIFAVRVPRQIVASNLQFLGAVADLTLPPITPNAPPIAPPRAPIEPAPAPPAWRAQLPAITAAVLLSPAAMFLNWAITIAQIAPTSPAGASPLAYSKWTASSTLRPGEPLIIEAMIRRSRLCQTTIERAVIAADATIAFSDRVIGTTLPVNAEPQFFRKPVPLPVLPAGAYTYRVFVFSECGAGEVIAEQRPDLAFKVTE